MQSQGRRASDETSTRAPRRRVDAQRVALAVLIAFASLSLIYLVAANVILRTRVLRDAVSEGPDIELDYTSAYSVWPGRVHVRGLSFEVQDYNVQFAVLADSAVVDVKLADLLLRRFHASHVALAGLSFRFRPKVEPAVAGSARVAAFPPISAFPDPPVYVGEKPPPIGDGEYDLWQIALDDVHAELRELWFMEYRYLGAGRIQRGGFRVQPARAFAVYPAHVSLEHGALSVGNDVAVQRFDLDLEAYIDATDVETEQGPALVDNITGRLSLATHGVSLPVLDPERHGRRPRITGSADVNAELAVRSGRLEPGGVLELTSDRVSLRTPIGRLAGAVSSSLKSLPDGRIEWLTTSPKLGLDNAKGQRGPELDAPRLALVLQAEILATLPRLRELEFDVPNLSMPSLAWAQNWLERAQLPIELDGRLEGQAHLSIAPERGPAARLHLRLADAKLSTRSVHAALSGSIDAAIDPTGHASSSTGRVDLELDGVEVERVNERSKPFHAAVRLPDLQVTLEPEPAFSTGVSVYAKPADSLLSMALGSPMLEDLAADVLALRRLDAQAQLNVSRRAVRLELSHAESGALEGAGYWQRPAKGDARGAFLISSKVANVGISLNGSDTETAWFVPNDWLAAGRHPTQRNSADAKTPEPTSGAQPARPRPAEKKRPSTPEARR